MRKFCYQAFEDKIDSWDFNSEMELPIIPAIHGTQTNTAWSICSTGFAALSATDAGFFGKGIYFTTSCKYAFPYCMIAGDTPCMIVTLLTPGNIYPVNEDHKGDKTLLGGAIKPGYNMHYVLTDKDGNCLKTPTDHHFDELVVDQETQIVPILVIELDGKATKEASRNMDRDVPQGGNNTIAQPDETEMTVINSSAKKITRTKREENC